MHATLLSLSRSPSASTLDALRLRQDVHGAYWRDAASNPRIWRGLCTSKWPWLGGLPVDAIDWKERYKTLAKCGRANPLQEMINLDDYDFFITARVAKAPEGQDEGDLLFIHRATWYERFADVYLYPPGDHHLAVTGAALSVTLDEPLKRLRACSTFTQRMTSRKSRAWSQSS